MRFLRNAIFKKIFDTIFTMFNVKYIINNFLLFIIPSFSIENNSLFFNYKLYYIQVEIARLCRNKQRTLLYKLNFKKIM